MSVFAILFQVAGPVPVESLNLTTGGEVGGGDMCPTEADIMEASSYEDRDDRSDVVEVVERVGKAPGSPTMDELCSNVSKMGFNSSSRQHVLPKPIPSGECVCGLISGGWPRPNAISQLEHRWDDWWGR